VAATDDSCFWLADFLNSWDNCILNTDIYI
jgi:hypothetical protein